MLKIGLFCCPTKLTKHFHWWTTSLFSSGFIYKFIFQIFSICQNTVMTLLPQELLKGSPWYVVSVHAGSAGSCWLIAFTASFIAFSLHTFPQWLQKPFESRSSLPLLTSNSFKNAGPWKSKVFNFWVLWSYSRNLG